MDCCGQYLYQIISKRVFIEVVMAVEVTVEILVRLYKAINYSVA